MAVLPVPVAPEFPAERRSRRPRCGRGNPGNPVAATKTDVAMSLLINMCRLQNG